MINQLLLTNGQFIRVGAQFPGGGFVDKDGKFQQDHELVRMIVERPASTNDDGDVEPAHYECWVLPEAFEAAMRAALELRQVERGREEEIKQRGAAVTPAPSENLIKTVVGMQAELEANYPKVLCHKVQSAQVVSASETVTIGEAWNIVSETLAVRLGMIEDGDDGDEDEEEASVVQAAPPS